MLASQVNDEDIVDLEIEACDTKIGRNLRMLAIQRVDVAE
jgi:hypothetical protein